MDKSLNVEYFRPTALRLDRYDEKTDTNIVMYLPQIEEVKFDSITGNFAESYFKTLTKKDSVAFAMFENELDAIKFAINYRDELV